MFKKIVYGLVFTLLISHNLFPQGMSEGVKLIKVEKYNTAKNFFRSFLNTDKKAEAYFYLGEIYFITDDLDSAKNAYSNGIKSDKEQPINYAGMVKLNLLANETAEADNNTKTALELSNEKSALVYNILAEAYSNPNVKKYSKAKEFLVSAQKVDPAYIQSYINLSEINLAMANGTEALKNIDAVLKMDSKNAQAMTIKAKIYILIDKSNEAILMLNDAIKYDPTYSPAYNDLAELYASLKDYSKAAEYYEKYIQASENNLEKERRYASILYINKEYEKSIKILEDVLTVDSNSVTAIRIIAYSYMRMGNLEKSKNYFEKLFEIKNADFQISDYENYADVLSKTGDEILALKYLSKIVELDSSKKDVLGKMSVIYFKNKNWDGVISSLTKKGDLTSQEYFDLSKADIFKGDNNITNALQYLTGKVRMENGQDDKVRQILLLYQRDISDAKNDKLKINDAKIKAMQSVESLLKPNQKKDWNIAKDDWGNLIESSISTEYAQADSCLSILISKVPNLAIAYIWQARVKADFDPDSESGLAKPFYDKFIELAKNDPDKFKRELIESYSYLGYYYYLQKDNQKSKAYWQEVIMLEPENKQANEVIKQLK